MPEDNEDESDYDEQDGVDLDFDDKAQKLHSPSSRSEVSNDKESGQQAQPSKMKSLIHSPTIFSPLCSPQMSPPNTTSPKSEVRSRNEPITLLRLKSIRLKETAAATSLPVSQSMSNGYSNSSVELNDEMIV